MLSKKTILYFIIFMIALLGSFYLSFKNFSPSPSTLQEKGHHGKSSIGGAFKLKTLDGKLFTQEHLKGKYSLVYFGYTFCPDICPMALDHISKALSKLPPPIQKKFQPIFITIDPTRDTPKTLKSFIRHFHPSWKVLFGNPEDIKKVKKAYRVYSAKVKDDSEKTPYYLMDHSSLVYVMDPNGTHVTHFTHETNSQEISILLKQLSKKL